MEIKPVELIGERVEICPMEVNHIQELFDAGNTPNIWSYMPIKVQSIEDMRYLVNGARSEERRVGKECGARRPRNQQTAGWTGSAHRWTGERVWWSVGRTVR